MLHRHVWQKVSQETQPAPIEIMQENGVRRFKARGLWGDESLLSVRPVIVSFHCAKCGADKVVRV
jgi:hypothetical protein